MIEVQTPSLSGLGVLRPESQSRSCPHSKSSSKRVESVVLGEKLSNWQRKTFKTRSRFAQLIQVGVFSGWIHLTDSSTWAPPSRLRESRSRGDHLSWDAGLRGDDV
mgnify:CR=1 FL=1